MAGDAETGVMVMQMDRGLDTGPVLMAERVAVDRKTAGELTAELARLGADLMVRALAGLERGAVTAVPQSEDGVTYAKKIAKDEARIDWTNSAAAIDAQIRGLSPVPGAFTEVKGERLKILYAEPVARNGSPGEVIDDGLTIACGDGALRLLRVQRAGKGVMDAADLLKGFAVPRGTRLS
jgi:methionyl-tRNA formyltransferase